ncbi:3'-5' exonuclease [Methylobacterium aquaticum]|uniref:Exonuclease VIII, ds DNA exonuclease encoded by prophage n=1 Tax=Methylobacterium aquaticum TaxID=270351 RepID=A0A0C6G2K6_9HYPH|nr:3'-5' exonuclease [Methylobacterium aquaticum]BAQ50375.1 exonuclease VIII, ds DNA exonuclease encoded by prophage [Methylobacterium aquaticum]
MTMRDIMIDLETLSTRPDAMIVAIGAVKFGPEGLGEEYYAVVDTRYAVGHIDAMTVAWWMRQSEEARGIFQEGFRDTKHIAAALEGLIGFVGDAPDQVRVWGHGASFDLPILESAFRACCRKAPWGHRAIRDTRTLYELAGVKVEMPEGEKHHALADAKAQALAVIRGVRALGAWHIWSKAD